MHGEEHVRWERTHARWDWNKPQKQKVVGQGDLGPGGGGGSYSKLREGGSAGESAPGWRFRWESGSGQSFRGTKKFRTVMSHQSGILHSLIFTAHIRRMTGGYIFTLCVCPHLEGGGDTGGTYLPRSGWGGTYLPGRGGYLPSQVWTGGTYLPGGTYLARSVGGGYLPSQVRGYLPR